MGLAPAKDNRVKAGETLHKNVVIVQAHDLKVVRKDDGGSYDAVRATVAVISGRVSEELEELAGSDELPIVLEDIRLTEIGITSRLDKIVGKYDDDDTPKLVVGSIQKYTNTKGGTSYQLKEATDEQLQAAVKYVAANPDVFPDRDPFAGEARAAKAFDAD